MVWVSAFSDKVFSLKNTYAYFWWQQSERSSLGSSYWGESIQFDLLYLHKRCFPRIDNGLKDSKVSSITDTKFYFHLLIFTAKTDVLHVAAERHFGEQKIWDVLVIPGHQNTQDRKITYNHLWAEWDTGQPKGRLVIVLQLAHDTWSWVSCIHKALLE